VDPLHVVKLLLVHDIVEIDAGDAPIHVAGKDKAALEREERRAAERIFRPAAAGAGPGTARPLDGVRGRRDTGRALRPKRWTGCDRSSSTR
jgi:hypothetical protein